MKPADNDGSFEKWGSVSALEPEPGAQETLRVEGIAIGADFIVKMRPGGSPGGPHAADYGSGRHDRSLGRRDRRHMCISRRQAVAVVDFHHQAVSAVPSGLHDFAGRCRPNRVTWLSTKIHARMQGKLPDEWIEPHAEAARDVRPSVGRPAQRNRRN